MIIKSLKQLTYYEDSEISFYFTPINYYFDYVEKNYLPSILNYVKNLLLIKHLELCEKYGYIIDSDLLEKYLGSNHNIATGREMHNFLENSKMSDDLNIQREYLFTSEFNNYFWQLIEILNSQDARKKLRFLAVQECFQKYQFTNEKEDVFNDNFYDNFRKYVINEKKKTSFQKKLK